MLIEYGTTYKKINITNYCLVNLSKNNVIYIPENDNIRAAIFSDPVFGVLKFIFITNKSNETSIYDHTKNIYIDIITNIVTVDDDDKEINKLANIHKQLRILYGSFSEEYPEQIMATKFLTGNEKILEIGGNIGRNSLIIAHILNSNGNRDFVTLECSNESALKLAHNKNINNLDFYIETSALSKRKLIQKDWNTIESDVLLDGYTNVNTITLDQLYSKYNIMFDTLILDCEGAFYYILMDMPEILKNVNLIIMENDYFDLNIKKTVDNILKSNGFCVVYSRQGGWGPCIHNFYEVWKK